MVQLVQYYLCDCVSFLLLFLRETRSQLCEKHTAESPGSFFGVSMGKKMKKKIKHLVCTEFPISPVQSPSYFSLASGIILDGLMKQHSQELQQNKQVITPQLPVFLTVDYSDHPVHKMIMNVYCLLNRAKLMVFSMIRLVLIYFPASV